MKTSENDGSRAENHPSSRPQDEDYVRTEEAEDSVEAKESKKKRSKKSVKVKVKKAFESFTFSHK